MTPYLRRALQDTANTSDWVKGSHDPFNTTKDWSSTGPFANVTTDWSNSSSNNHTASHDSDKESMDSTTFIIVVLSIILFLIIMSGTKWFGKIACCRPQAPHQDPIRPECNFKLTISQKRAGLEFLFDNNNKKDVDAQTEEEEELSVPATRSIPYEANEESVEATVDRKYPQIKRVTFQLPEPIQKQRTGAPTTTATTNETHPSKQDLPPDDEEICSICLCPYESGEKTVRSRHCTHKFHKDCIFDWLVKDTACPICRNRMVSELDLRKACRAASALQQQPSLTREGSGGASSVSSNGSLSSDNNNNNNTRLSRSSIVGHQHVYHNISFR